MGHNSKKNRPEDGTGSDRGILFTANFVKLSFIKKFAVIVAPWLIFGNTVFKKDKYIISNFLPISFIKAEVSYG